MKVIWANAAAINPKDFTCGFCQKLVASASGFYSSVAATGSGSPFCLRICPNCTMPTLFTPSGQTPGASYGEAVEHLPENIGKTYEEARKSYTAGAYTSSVLMCRKMLMNIAVEKGAKAGETFAFYVSYLASHHYVPPGSETWVGHIRGKGNEATHEIHLMSQEDAQELLTFTSMMLKFIYEFPGKIASKKAP